MRKSRILAAAMLLTLAGCMNNLGPMEPDELAGIPLTVRATVGDSGTKTVLQSDGVYWLNGDAINMFYGSKFDGRFVTELAEPSKVAEFRGELTVVTGTSNPGGESQNYWGVYPYDEGNTCDGSGVMLTIPSAQPGAAGTFAPNLNPTVATGPGLDLAFYNVGSWLMFSVAQEGITSATLKGNGDEDLAGQIYVTMDGSGHPVSTMVSGTKSITITPAEGSFAPGEFYYIVLFPQTLSQGFTLTLNKGALYAEKVISSQLTFPRNTPLQLSTADKNLEFSSTVPVPEIVDLGLPSGVKWASFNLGASAPEGYGDYYAWGETEPYYSSLDPLTWKEGKTSGYEWTSYFWCNGTGNALNKYCIDGSLWDGVGSLDGKTVLDLEDDAAHVALGDNWRMPTHSEYAELIENCTWNWVNENGVAGVRFTSKSNSNSIFLPAAGFMYETDSASSGQLGLYWSSSLDDFSTIAWNLYLDPLFIWDRDIDYGRAEGLSIRPVYDESMSTPDPVPELVDLGLSVKWASFNLGASVPEEYGDYYAWGETETKGLYTWDTYTVKYKDNQDNLALEDDVAHIQYGDNWRIPTREEFNELIENCSWESTTLNGVNGYRVTSNKPGFTDKSIFLPAAGDMAYSSLTDPGNTGMYTSSTGTVGNGNSYYLIFNLGNTPGFVSLDPQMNILDRYYGSSVRAVYAEPGPSPTDAIQFADAEVKRICVANWDTNGDGELSYAEAAAVIDLSNVFKSNTVIVSFDELQYFTGLTEIAYNAFNGCTRLASILIPEGVTSIGASSFNTCRSLSSLVIPESVTNIGNYAFDGCTGLKSVSIPGGLTSIGRFIFRGVSSVEKLYITSIESWCTYSISIGGDRKILYLNGEPIYNLVIPSGVPHIGNGAFNGCVLLRSVIVPNSVTSIGESAFSGCTSLSSVQIPEGITSINSNTFYGCRLLTGITIPGSVTSIGVAAFAYCTQLDNIIIPESVTQIDRSAFAMTGLTCLTIPEGVTSISGYLFSGCEHLTTVSIPEGVVSIDDSAFASCTKLTTIKIPESVKSIGYGAFKNCSSLNSIIIPENVTIIESKAFYCCNSLGSVIMKGTNPPSLGTEVFWYQYGPNTYKILVPEESVEVYKVAESWSEYINNIVANTPEQG